MRMHRLPIALTLVNLALLIFTIAQMRPAVAQGVAPVLRGRALEIVLLERQACGPTQVREGLLGRGPSLTALGF